MQDDDLDAQPLNNQKFRLLKTICLIAILLVLSKNLVAPYLTDALGLMVQAAELLILSWIIYQLGIYTCNFGKSTIKVFTTLFAGIIILKLGYSVLIVYMPQFQYQGLMLLFSTLFISLYFIIGRYIRDIRYDFVGGLKYVGILFIAKSIIIFAGLLISVAITYLIINSVQKSIVTGLWLTSNFLSIFVDFATYYILFKIFSNADLMPSN